VAAEAMVWQAGGATSLTSPEEVTVFTDSCCGEPGSVRFILSPLVICVLTRY